MGIFFAETNGNQNIGNARSNTYKGSLQTGPSEDRNGQQKWAAIRKAITSPALIARDDREEARAGSLDHRYNHWTAVRDGLANAHADVFLQIPAIARTLPEAIDDPVARDPLQPGRHMHDRLHQPVGRHQLDKRVLDNIIDIAEIVDLTAHKGPQPRPLGRHGRRNTAVLVV